MLWVRIAVYHTQFSVAYFLGSTLLSKIFDVGDRDLPVLTSGNWVIKGWVIKWPVKLRTFFLRFLRFFSKSKKHDILRFFEWLTTFSRTLTPSIDNYLIVIDWRSRVLPWRHFTQKSTAVWWVYMKHLSGACAVASADSRSIVGYIRTCFVSPWTQNPR